MLLVELNILGFGRKTRLTLPFRAGGMYTPGQVLKAKAWYIERINSETVHLRAQLGKISVLGDKCDLSVDYLPLHKWNDIALLSHINSED